MSSHTHAIPEITHWMRDRYVNSGGVAEHGCYFCRPWDYPPMPRNCTLCARCGVFMWIGRDDPHNGAMEVCDDCLEELEND